jgi:hypothetical protein
MKFTVEVRSGFCNTLKSLVTALSIEKNSNIKPLKNAWWPDGAAWDNLLDDKLICHNDSEFGESFITARFLILKEEHDIQPTLYNDAWHCGGHPDIMGGKLQHLFSDHSICIGFFDRSLICDKVFNRIQLGIKRIKWHDEIINEFNRVKSQLIDSKPILTIQIRTWQNKQGGDADNLLELNTDVQRKYSFELYKSEIDKFLSKDKTIFLTIDREDLLPQYINYLEGCKIVTYYKNESNLTSLQHSAVTMLLGSLSDFLVCSRLSTFGECMWWFGGCKAKVLPVG